MPKLLKPRGYVDTGRTLPPIQRSECIIIPSKELVDLACERLGLDQPVCKLSERPGSYNANGWVRVNNKWVAGQPIHNNGMLSRQPLFMKS